MNIIEKRIEDIIPYDNNPRINDNAVRTVANSIKSFGFKVPIVIDKSNVIICGHTRLKAAIALGLKTVPCYVAENLDEEQIKAYRLADNKTAELAYWDDGLLLNELRSLLDTDIDMSMFNFVDFTSNEDIEEAIEENTNETIKDNAEYLTFANQRIPLQDGDKALLLSALSEYVNESGILYGFAQWLVDRKVNKDGVN